MGTCAIVSFRLGLSDGVSVVAAAWERVLRELGWSTYRVAGAGGVDHLVPGLAMDATAGPDPAEVTDALAPADLVLVENLLSIPLNLAASRVVARVLAGRPAILHHHDPPWQRARFAHVTELPPDDPCWRHVAINRLTAAELRSRGLDATVIHNGFDPDPPTGDRDGTRARLGVADDRLLAAHPVRAIARKNVPAAIAITERLGGVYWLPGPTEEGYGVTLAGLLARAGCPVLRAELTGALTVPDLYAASDVVLFPSTWEGFGNPPVEAALHRRPVVVGSYPVADELRQLGFRWYGIDEVDVLAKGLADPELDGAGPGGVGSLAEAVATNRVVAAEELSTERMAAAIGRLLDDAGWRP